MMVRGQPWLCQLAETQCISAHFSVRTPATWRGVSARSGDGWGRRLMRDQVRSTRSGRCSKRGRHESAVHLPSLALLERTPSDLDGSAVWAGSKHRTFTARSQTAAIDSAPEGCHLPELDESRAAAGINIDRQCVRTRV